jgi:hypothetical protein
VLVRGVWFEGLPLDQAAELGPADGELLAELLADPAESAHHTNIVMALGACSCGPAFEALELLAALPVGNDANHDTRSAQATRLALRQAMGLLARSDARALAWLELRAGLPAPGPGDRAGRRRRAALLQGLALSRSPRATALLGELEAAAHARGDAGLARRAARARVRSQTGPRQ